MLLSFEISNAINIGPYAEEGSVYFSLCLDDVIELIASVRRWTNADENRIHPHGIGSIPSNGLTMVL